MNSEYPIGERRPPKIVLSAVVNSRRKKNIDIFYKETCFSFIFFHVLFFANVFIQEIDSSDRTCHVSKKKFKRERERERERAKKKRRNNFYNLLI